ncbi:Rrf2 family transcriptional regulator [Halarchaeum nitratireducens]|uniref:Uncharacterized protein n=1 Tax=Halarchaeum nitratireducens TaxID=489913 RepID=A0A830GEA6_9EURY|nr:Rrf2 family transcriptional regulator [Halarchaeum nitratireducens]GGN25357.1 hypothetical protein GCM10009021_29160 [Halarchaeum nitratireducens]
MCSVEWVVTTLREHERATTSELAEAKSTSKRHVAKTTARLVDAERVTTRESVGAHGAMVYGADSETVDVVNHGAREIANDAISGSYT